MLAIDRSAKAIAAAEAAADSPANLRYRIGSAEEFELADGEHPFHLAFAVRVGALDGRHPEAGQRAIRRIAAALKPGGKLLVDGGDPLRELPLPDR